MSRSPVTSTEPHLLAGRDSEPARRALLEERWADAFTRWVHPTGIDVSTARIAVDDDLPAEPTGAQLPFTPLCAGT